MSGDSDDHQPALDDRRLLEGFYEVLYANNPDVIITLNRDNVIQAVNPSGAKTLGIPETHLRNEKVAFLFQEDSAATLLNLLSAGKVGVSDGLLVLSDGRKVNVSISWMLEQDIAVIVLRDISHIYTLQQTVQRSLTMASIGNLAADLAHAISNPLAVVQGNIELFSMQQDLDLTQLTDKLKILRENCDRIKRIIDNLQTVASPQPPERTHVRLSDVIKQVRAQTHWSTQGRRLTVNIEPDELTVYADPDQVRKVVSNLLTMAITATPRHGTVRLAATIQKNEAHLLVEDEGHGLTRERLAALRAAQGLRMPDPIVGLPLALTWALVHQNDGRLYASNRPNLGASYRISLPLQPKRADEPAVVGPELLVIDDEQALRELVELMLRREGYRIQTVTSAEQALERVRRHRTMFDAILTDIRLPGMDGEDFVDVLLERYPAYQGRIILVSALMIQPRTKTPFLRKPFQPERLIDIVQQVLSSQATRS
ncbi:MAG: response regulator [Myxococcota bacterium]